VTADPSPVAAARRAAALARRTGARLLLLHVVSREAAPVDFDRLQDDLAPLLEGISVTPLLCRGPPAREILAVARQEHADLILLTRHRRWHSGGELGFPRFLLHSVLCRVVLDADCPVWVEPEAGMPRDIGHVLCGVASLFLDRELIGHAAAMAGRTDAGLILFRSALSAAIAVPGQQQRTDEWQADVIAAARADLEALRADMGVPAELHVGAGNFTAALLQGATDTGAGLIAVRRTSRDWGRDETLHPLVRGAMVPVLVCPGEPPRPVAAMPARKPLSLSARLAWVFLVVLVGIWLMHLTFTVVNHPDVCGSHPMGCDYQENLKRTTQDRMNQPQPKIDPKKIGPFSEAPPEDAPRPRP
jgi:nucleotide-binding universal stress UspA family protein